MIRTLLLSALLFLIPVTLMLAPSLVSQEKPSENKILILCAPTDLESQEHPVRLSSQRIEACLYTLKSGETEINKCGLPTVKK
jgi:hypothetical protein